MIDVFNSAREFFRPTPSKSHYIYSLRDINRVFRGMVMVPPKRLQDPEKLARLCCHEVLRVFGDR